MRTATSSSSGDLSILVQRLNLEDSNARLKQLQDIKTILISLPHSSSEYLIPASDIKTLFPSLDSENDEEVEVACYIINKSLAVLNSVDVLNELSSYLLKGLEHENHDVIDLVMKQLTRMLDTSITINALIESPEIVGQVIDLLGDEDVAVAASANKLLTRMGLESERACALMLSTSTDSLLARLVTTMQQSDIIRFRVYELVCNIGGSSEETLQLCINSGILNRLFQEFKETTTKSKRGHDVLLKVTCCTMLADFVSSSHVLNYLVQAGVVNDMIETIKKSASDPFASLYVPGVIRFFGKICLYNGARYVTGIFGSFVVLLISMLLEPSERSMQQIAVETIGVVGRTCEGKICLSEQDQIKPAVREIFRLTSCSDKELQIAAISTLASLFDHSLIDDEEKVRVTPITYSWFNSLPNTMSCVISLCKQPLSEVQVAAFDILKSVATCEWGLRCMHDYGSFVEFLLDRSVTGNIDCKQARFELILQLSKLPHCGEIFGNRDYLRFRQYVNDGVHFIETQLQVAVDEV